MCDGLDDKAEAGDVLNLPNATFTIDFWLTTTAGATAQYALRNPMGPGLFYPHHE